MICTRAVVAAGFILVLGCLEPASTLAQVSGPQGQIPPQFSTSPAPQFSTGIAPFGQEPAPPTGSLGDVAPTPTVAAGAGWNTQVEAAPQAPAGSLDARMLQTVGKINAYFNGIVNLQGRFIQTDPDKKQSKGKFYVQRPGLLRFDYAPPSKMRIVADGRYLSIENHDLKTIDKYPLEATPFRMLLRTDVDLVRDARLLNYTERDGYVVLSIEDRSGESAGQLQLVFVLTEGTPGVDLREWIITDPQGLNTRIQLADMERGKEVASDFFAAATLGVSTRQ
jgi:outer membrane lipoprotein-sorting protein